jgi:hypothetical protein
MKYVERKKRPRSQASRLELNQVIPFGMKVRRAFLRVSVVL